MVFVDTCFLLNLPQLGPFNTLVGHSIRTLILSSQLFFSILVVGKLDPPHPPPWAKRIELRERQLLPVYKSWGLLYPFACKRAVVATPAATLGGAEEAKTLDYQSSARARGGKSEGTRWASPGKSLAGAAYVAPARALPGQLTQHQQDRHP